MATTKKKINYYDSEIGTLVRKELESISNSEQYNTESTYISNSAEYPDNLIPFVEKHIKYLNDHQNVDWNHHISNLRLMTRIR